MKFYQIELAEELAMSFPQFNLTHEQSLDPLPSILATHSPTLATYFSTFGPPSAF